MKPCVACEDVQHGLVAFFLFFFFSLFDFFSSFFKFTTGYCVTLYKDIWRRPSVRSCVVSGCLGLEDLDVIPEQLLSSQRGCRLAAIQPTWQGEHDANAWLCFPQSCSRDDETFCGQKGERNSALVDLSFGRAFVLLHQRKHLVLCCVIHPQPEVMVAELVNVQAMN